MTFNDCNIYSNRAAAHSWAGGVYIHGGEGISGSPAGWTAGSARFVNCHFHSNSAHQGPNVAVVSGSYVCMDDSTWTIAHGIDLTGVYGWGGGSVSTCPEPPPPSTPPVPPQSPVPPQLPPGTSLADARGLGLSTGALIGIAAGGGVVVCAAGCIAGWYQSHRELKARKVAGAKAEVEIA